MTKSLVARRWRMSPHKANTADILAQTGVGHQLLFRIDRYVPRETPRSVDANGDQPSRKRYGMARNSIYGQSAASVGAPGAR